MTDDPTVATFKQEIRQVITRHNELAREQGHGMLCAVLAEMAGSLAYERNVDVELHQGEVNDNEFVLIQYGDTAGSIQGLDPEDVDDASQIADAIDSSMLLGTTETGFHYTSSNRGESV